jgi:hypothetical protein
VLVESSSRAGNATQLWAVAMSKKTQVLIALIALCLIDAVIPLFPIAGIILIYVVVERPPWFLDLVRQLYGT